MNGFSRLYNFALCRKLTLFNYARAPVSVNLTLLLVVFPLMFLTRGVFIGLFASFLLAILVVFHELGHAWVCRRLNIEVLEINVGFPFGYCAYDTSNLDRYKDGLVAWGGVLAQGVLLVAALLTFRYLEGDFSAPSRYRLEFPWVYAIWHTFIGVNIIIIICNLLPFPGLDGSRAWQVLPRMLTSGLYKLLVRNKSEAGIEKNSIRNQKINSTDEVNEQSRAVVVDFLERMRKNKI